MALRISVILIMFLAACEPITQSDQEPTDNERIMLSYAKGFEIEPQGKNIYRVLIKKPYQNARESQLFYLVPENENYEAPPEAEIIRTPVKRIICTSTTHIPLLDYLDETESLVGFPTPEYISSPKMKRHIQSGNVADLGVDKAMNMELALALEPDVIMAYSVTGNDPVNQKLREFGIPVLMNAEYLEDHPLGRAEWIKLAGLLYNKFEVSDSIFQSIREAYIANAERVRSVKNKPKAFSGVMYGDTWFLPGGDNYAAKLMADAGISYLWKENRESGYLEISFESVMEKAREADLWIGVASYRSLDAMLKEDERYGLFKSFKNGEVYTYSTSDSGIGSPYLEVGYLRPDQILSDLIQIAHPGNIDQDTMRFYSKLKP